MAGRWFITVKLWAYTVTVGWYLILVKPSAWKQVIARRKHA